MHKYMDDICMLVIIVGCLILLICHIDGEVKSILTMAGVYFFYKSYTKIKKGDK